MIELIQPLINFFHALLQIDVTLFAWAQDYGTFLYVILFLIIFAETGLVFTPFLPGDSLLFAVGALCAKEGFLDIKIIIPLLITAASVGDSLNYHVGKKYGRILFEKDLFFFKKKYLAQTQEFYEKKGIWAISLSRFFPIIRTFSPFFAGLSGIAFRKFFILSVSGSIVWVFVCSLAGFYFGQVEIIQKNFTLLVLGIIAVSMIPIAFNVLKALRAQKA